MTAGVLMAVGILLAVAGWVWAWSAVRDASLVAIIAVLAMAGGVGRVLLAGIPAVEPITAIVVITVATLGVRSGAAVGMLAVLVSNTALGHGPWTFWQVAGFALAALVAAALVGRSAPRGRLAASAAAAALAYDLLLIASQPAALGIAELTLADYRAYLLLGLPLTVVHMASVAAVTWWIAPTLGAALGRAERRTGIEPARPRS